MMMPSASVPRKVRLHAECMEYHLSVEGVWDDGDTTKGNGGQPLEKRKENTARRSPELWCGCAGRGTNTAL